uniref:Fe/S biogenesis protein NfuA n=1 Tax=Candidatus Aschnera chinzeii TaxID=1485666 RepID=A0AAT9G406_9ENTR|nr:MAG: Fe-S biogenesis protein NfuA [Candidatus Aschnera chinzeii]
MLKITKKAQLHFLKLLENKKPGTQIRVFVINPGTSVAECGISYCLPDDIKDTDVKIKFNDFFVYVDEISIPFLEEAKIDFLVNKFSSQLTIKAPNIKKNNLNNNLLFDKIHNFIQSNINPQLNLHNGYVSLIDITHDGYVILNFHGGCNGCSMADITLKEAIEKQLLNMFPHDLKGVKDLTKHNRGIHSYY